MKVSWTRGSTLALASVALKDGQFLLDTTEDTLSADVNDGTTTTRRLLRTEPASITEAFIRALFSDDDILTFANLAAFPAQGDASKTYIALDTGKAYIWNGTSYEEFDYGENSPVTFGFGFGTCDTASATSAKVVTLSGYRAVANGYVSVYFENSVLLAATMNINSQGAKPIYYRGAAISSYVIKAGDIATFIFDGTYYHLIAIDRDIANVTILSETLAAGSTSVTFTGTPVSGDYFFTVYTSKAGLDYTSMDDSVSGSLTVSYEAQSSAITVYLKIERI